MAPGLSIDTVPVLGASDKMPHPWQGGPQTRLLAHQLKAMPSGGVVVLSIPRTPYCCSPDPAPVTNSACFSTITMSQASWLTAVFQYDAATAAMKAVAASSAASTGWDSDNFEDMDEWFKTLMGDSFA
jgi:hypothetical protein